MKAENKPAPFATETKLKKRRYDQSPLQKKPADASRALKRLPQQLQPPRSPEIAILSQQLRNHQQLVSF